MALPPKPKDSSDGNFGSVGDVQPVQKEVLVLTQIANSTLRATITSGLPFFEIANFEVDSLELVSDPGEHGQTLRSWEESFIAKSDGSTPLTVATGQRVHVTVSLTVPKNRLPAGPLNGVLAIEGGATPISIPLRSVYTPTPPPVPAPGPSPVDNPGGGGSGSSSGGPSGECPQLRQDRTNQDVEMAQFQRKLQNTTGPDAPGNARDQLEKAIALLQQEIAATEATMEEQGCFNTVAGPRTIGFNSPVYGSVTLQGAILSRWLDLATQQTVNGQTVQDFLGQPVRPTRFVTQTARQLDVQEFEHGVLIDVEGNDLPFVVYGAIYARYRQLGGWDGFLGAPVSDELDMSRGRVSAFDGGWITWDPVSGNTHEIHGAIRDRWLALKGAGGPLGCPASDELPLLNHDGPIGSYQLFDGPNGSGGAIYLSPTTGASEIYGPILKFWLGALGGVTGTYGLPTAIQTTTGQATEFHQFQNGIVVNPADFPSPIALQGGLKLQVFDFIVEDDFNVQVNITTSTGQNIQARIPADGQFPAGDHKFGPDTMLTAPAVDQSPFGISIPPDLVINIEFQAISERLVGKDALKGVITATYNIDNAWGLTEFNFRHQADSFAAVFELQPLEIFPVGDNLQFRQQAFWPFRNFDVGDMGWDQYEQTYSDIAAIDKNIDVNPLHLNIHIFEIIFYETVYRSMSAHGVCFGMGLESIYARVGRSLFIEPVFSANSYQADRYALTGNPLNTALPNSAEVGNAVTVKNGYQFGAECVNFVLGKWTAGALHDPVRAFRESRDANARGDWSILTVSNGSEFSGDGHAVVPYQWNGDTSPILPGQRWEILCANPNNPPGTNPSNDDSHCKIVVMPFEQQFQFDFGVEVTNGPDVTWTGSNESGGRLLTIPFSVLSCQPVTLGNEIFALLTTGLVLILGGAGAQSNQIADENGRTLFATKAVPSQDGSPTQNIRVMNPNIATRVPNLMPLPTHQVTSGSAPEVYYWARDTQPLKGLPATDTSAMELHHDIQSPEDTPYQYTLHSNSSTTSITSDRGSPSGHRVSLLNLGAARQKIVIHPPADGIAAKFSIRTAGWQANRATPNWFEFQAPVGPGQELHFHVGNAGTHLTVFSANADATLDITMFSRGTDPDVAPVSAGRSQLQIPAGQVLRFEPSSWKTDELPTSTVSRSVLASFGATEVLSSTVV